MSATAQAKKVKFTLDGKEVEAAEGQLVIDAAKAAGVDVPHYCYHPALGNPGVCRLCVVEVEGMPKLQVSCRLPVKEGMVVKSNSANARRAQASSLEFHLLNHPLDCPVCDQAGECWLQDYYIKYGQYKSAVREDKEHKHKRLDIGRHIMLDSERCILCTRCTRFLDNVTQTHELGIFNRGHHSELLPYPGVRVDNAYSVNVVDICPVGALTEKDFRFQVRVWYLDKTPSVCPGCARGCSIDIHSNSKRPWHGDGKRIARLKPRENPLVNGHWMCDEGRYSFRSVDAPTRLKAASVLASSGLERRKWPQAVSELSCELKRLEAQQGAAGLAVILSATLSNEDLYAARKLFVDRLKAGHVLVMPGPDQLGEQDELLRRKEKVPNHRGAAALGFGGKIKESSWDAVQKDVAAGKIWGLYVVDRDPLAVWGADFQAALDKLPLTVYHGANANLFSEKAKWVLPSCAYAEEECTFTNFDGVVQRTSAALKPLGDCRPEWAAWSDLSSALGGETAPASARELFEVLCRKETPFAGLDWESLRPNGRRLKA